MKENVCPVSVPRAVYEGIEAVRLSGQTNMLDRHAVIRLADRLGHPAAATWVHENPGSYSRGVFHGFREEPELGPGEQHHADPNPDPGHPDA